MLVEMERRVLSLVTCSLRKQGLGEAACLAVRRRELFVVLQSEPFGQLKNDPGGLHRGCVSTAKKPLWLDHASRLGLTRLSLRGCFTAV